MKYNKRFYSMGVALEAIVEIPDRPPDIGCPCIILCHGHSRHKNDGLDVLSAMLVKEGFLTVRMDFRGCGEQAQGRYHLYCGVEWPEDLISAVAFTKSIPGADAGRIGVCGISMGASTVVYTAGMEPAIKSVAAMAGVGNCREWLEWVWRQNGGDFGEFLDLLEKDSIITALTGKSQVINSLDMYHLEEKDKKDLVAEAFFSNDVNSFVSLDSLNSLLRYRPIDKCALVTQPVFFLHGEKDTTVPYRESENMYRAVGSQEKKIKKYPGVEHNIPMDPNRKDAFEDIVEWFLRTL